MYVAYYGRPGDSAGIRFWESQLSANKGSLEEIIDAFGNSEEFNSRFDNLSDEELIDSIYSSLFGRHADSEGLSFYLGQLQNGVMTLASIALDISNGVKEGTDDALIVNNKVSVAQIYTATVLENGVNYSEADFATVISLLAAVDSRQSTVDAALTAIDTILDPEQGVAPTAYAGPDETVTAGTTVLLAGNADGYVVNSVWSQIGGSAVVIVGEDQLTAEFIAPQLEIKTTLVFKLEVIDNKGLSAIDYLTITVEAYVEEQVFSFDRELDPTLTDTYAYKTDGPYSLILSTCTAVNYSYDACLFNELPLIGMDSENPDIEAIMDRVVVSHDWMGQRFREALTLMPVELLLLFRSVTGIVIDDDIRPSYYWGGTAVIYLDSAHLCLTSAECDTTPTEDDYRSDFGSSLSYQQFWRYVLNDDYPSDYETPVGDEIYVIDDILYELAALLFHELAHANDFLPSSIIESLYRDETPYRNISAVGAYNPAYILQLQSPLYSTTMFDLASVNFRGTSASTYLKSLSASQVSALFEFDGANDEYNYNSVREDVAMLFEEAMMKYHFGIDRDIAFVTTIDDPTDSCSDYIVDWGKRNRISDDHVKERAKLVVDTILPNNQMSEFFQDLSPSMSMRVGEDWCENLSQNVSENNTKLQRKYRTQKEVWKDMRKRRYR